MCPAGRAARPATAFLEFGERPKAPIVAAFARARATSADTWDTSSDLAHTCRPPLLTRLLIEDRIGWRARCGRDYGERRRYPVCGLDSTPVRAPPEAGCGSVVVGVRWIASPGICVSGVAAVSRGAAGLTTLGNDELWAGIARRLTRSA